MTSLAAQSIASWDETFRLVLSDLAPPGDWARRGRCRSVPVNVFFPGRGDTAAITQAREICARCPVLEECRAYALAAPQELLGVWGGLSGKERREARRELAQQETTVGVVPAAAGRTRRAWRGSLYRQLETLLDHEGAWARVVRYPSKHSGAAMASLLRNGQRTVPDGRFEYEGRLNDEGGSDLFARYLGPDEAEGVA